MAMARLEFLTRFRYWLVSGGMITRSAWGSTIMRSVALVPSPTARLASHWPLGTALMPGAHDLGDEGAGVDHQAQQQRRQTPASG